MRRRRCHLFVATKVLACCCWDLRLRPWTQWQGRRTSPKDAEESDGMGRGGAGRERSRRAPTPIVPHVAAIRTGGPDSAEMQAGNCPFIFSLSNDVSALINPPSVCANTLSPHPHHHASFCVLPPPLTLGCAERTPQQPISGQALSPASLH